MQNDATTTATAPKNNLIGPSEEPVPTITKVNVEFLSESASEPMEEPLALDLKTQIADRIRTDCNERGTLTTEDTLTGLIPGLQPEAVSAALAEMAEDPCYADIRAVTTTHGLVFFYSEKYIDLTEASAKCLIEEVKFRVSEKVRRESMNSQILTPFSSLYEEIDCDRGICSPDEIQKDPRYDDIKTVTVAATAEMYLYSTRHMSDYFALLLSRAAADDPCYLIAETVRDESRIYPRATCVLFFLEKLFGMNEADLKATVCKMQERVEFSDIQGMVHPATGGIYLYSSTYLDENTAFSLMDWQEVGKAANP